MNSPLFRVPLYMAVIAMGVVLMVQGNSFGFAQVLLGGLMLGLWIMRWTNKPDVNPDANEGERKNG